MAVTAHSPNRKPRVRILSRKIAKKGRSELNKQAIANGVAIGKSLEDASLAAGCGRSYGKACVESSPEYRELIEAKREEFRQRAVGILTEGLEADAREFNRLGLFAESEKVRANVLSVKFRGLGVLKGDGATVAVNNDNRSITIQVIDTEADVMLKRVISGERTEKELPKNG